ncbi:MAG: hypothetical protein H8E31_02110 [Planctomycetes bacterium]|nr:hypothetical protein [Planctomycetota bacterium]
MKLSPATLAATVLTLCPAAAAHVQLTSPNGGETLQGQSTFLIEWFDTVSHGNEVTYSLEFSEDGGVTWQSLAGGLPYTGGTSSYLWNVPDVDTSLGRIRVTMSINVFQYYQDTNDLYFTVRPSYLGYGAGTALNGVTPELEGIGVPAVGATVSIQASGAQPGALAHFLAGSQSSHRPAFGVTLLTMPDLAHLAMTVDSAGVAAAPVTLSSCMTGMTIYLQVVVESAPAFSATPGLACRVLP